MTAATVLAIFLVPTFFLLAARYMGRLDTREPDASPDDDRPLNIVTEE